MMKQFIKNTMTEYFSFIFRIMLTENEQNNLLELFLGKLPGESRNCIRHTVMEISDYDSERLGERLFFMDSYHRQGNPGEREVMQARLDALNARRSNGNPPIESRSKLMLARSRDFTLGDKYDRAVFNYAIGRHSEAEKELEELFFTHSCIAAGENLLCLLIEKDKKESAKPILEALTVFYAKALFMQLPEWLSEICADLNVSEIPSPEASSEFLSSYTTFDPEDPADPSSRERIGFI